MEMSQTYLNIAYMLSSICFIMGLKFLSSPKLARKGNLLSMFGMLLAILVAMISKNLFSVNYVLGALFFGTIVGVVSARAVLMTMMPQMVAIFNGFGGFASMLLAWVYYHTKSDFNVYTGYITALCVFTGGMTFSGSIIAFLKLNGSINKGRPVVFIFHKFMNLMILLFLMVICFFFSAFQGVWFGYAIFLSIILISLFLGISFVLPIGGADMPVVISLLNSMSGLAACIAGLIIKNNLLIVAGSLVGASGLILTILMCKAMSRSIFNVLFGAVGKNSGKTSLSNQEAKSISDEDAFIMLEAAQNVAIVPGYGLSVAKAQHALNELGKILKNNGAEVKYGIHPVAGRMPGHMNVLLAEADVPYEDLMSMDEINPIMHGFDVCLVIGANDVVNLSAKEDEKSSIYNMPIIEANRARGVIILKRTLSPGFSGEDNPLFYKANTCMLFGDAKKSLHLIISHFKD